MHCDVVVSRSPAGRGDLTEEPAFPTQKHRASRFLIDHSVAEDRRCGDLPLDKPRSFPLSATLNILFFFFLKKRIIIKN